MGIVGKTSSALCCLGAKEKISFYDLWSISLLQWVLSFQSSVAFHMETIHLIWSANQMVSIWNALVWNGLGEFYLTWEMLSMLNEIMNTEIQWNKNSFICLFVCLFLFTCFFHYFYQNAELSTSKISRELCNVKLQVYALTPVCKIRRPELLTKIRLRRLSKNSHCCRTPILNKNKLYLPCFVKSLRKLNGIIFQYKWSDFARICYLYPVSGQRFYETFPL